MKKCQRKERHLITDGTSANKKKSMKKLTHKRINQRNPFVWNIINANLIHGFFSSVMISSNTARVFSFGAIQLHASKLKICCFELRAIFCFFQLHSIFDWQSFRFVCWWFLIWASDKEAVQCTITRNRNSQCMNIIAMSGNVNEICFLYYLSNQLIISIQFNCKFCAGAGDQIGPKCEQTIKKPNNEPKKTKQQQKNTPQKKP